MKLYKQQQNGDTTKAKFEFDIVNKKGEIRYVEMNIKIIAELTGGTKTIVNIIDKTDQRKTEKELQESENKFKKIFEAIPDLFFLINKDAIILDYKGREKLYLPPEEFLGEKLFKLLPGELGKQAYDAIIKTLETKKQQLVEFHIPSKKEMLYYEARILYYSENQVATFVRNITQRKEAESMIKDEVHRLKEIDKIRKDLISRVSHELKTPIMVISGATEYLMDIFGKTLGKEPFELLWMIYSNEKRLEQLINDLLDISRIDYHKIKLEKERFNVCKLVMNISKELEYFIKERKLNLNLDLSHSIEVEIDIIRIEQVIVNLLSNAIKNTPPGGHIFITSKVNNNFLEIIFKDTGVGLIKEEINKLFTQFGKIERYGEGLEYLDVRGSGLGLYISKEIVKMHNGEIQVESNGRNKGSTFIMMLPLN